ncbi:MAG: NAD(P)-binding protein [Eubacteriales bacterium]|nr:NAD(P)-binding protein [Eubacteriales bacterium]
MFQKNGGDFTANIAIIGAGLAGLSTGIHLQQKGFQTEIFELADWAGGVCTAWVRSGYTFDGCIHWMVGTRRGDGFYQLYRDVDALAADTPIYNPPSLQMELDGTVYEVPLQAAGLRAFFTQYVPRRRTAYRRAMRRH